MDTDALPALEDSATPQRRPRDPLSRERILSAAVEFIERRCLGDLSMRKLGADLGVEAMSLYRYFPSKADLLDAVLEEVTADLRLPAPDEEWRDGLRAFARSFRGLAGSHPQLFPLVAGAGPRHPALGRSISAVADALGRAGFEGDAHRQALGAVVGYVMGTCAWTAATPDADAEFEFGLEVLLSGLEAKLAEARSPAIA